MLLQWHEIKKKEVIILAAALWAVFDVVSIATNVETVLVAGGGILLGFTVYKYLKRSSKAM